MAMRTGAMLTLPDTDQEGRCLGLRLPTGEHVDELPFEHVGPFEALIELSDGRRFVVELATLTDERSVN